MSTKQNNSEEIDLGQLFKLIGTVFNKIFRFVGDIFKGIFNLIISFLQFIRLHFLKFIIAAIIGIGIGWYLDKDIETTYISSMIVEPNFNSVQQLYNNIEFYDELAKQESYKSLAEALKISDSLASTVRSIYIESFSDETQKIKQFSMFIRELDSSSRNLVDYKDYLKNFNNINSRFHRIRFESSNPVAAKKSQKAIVSSIENNDYFRVQKYTNEENIKFNDSIIRKQLVEVDSLKSFYKQLKLLQLQRPENTSGTNINLSSKNQELEKAEIVLLKRSKLLSNEILVLNQRKADTENIVNIISDFPNKGALVNEFFSKKMVLVPIAFVCLTFIILSLLSLNSYLKNFNKRNNK